MIKKFSPIIAVFLPLFLFSFCHFSKKNPNQFQEKNSTPTKLTPNKFGIYENNFSVRKGKVKWGNTFSDLLLKYGVPYKKILEIADSVKRKFDLHKVKKGDEYFAYLRNGKLKYFVLQPDVTHYLKIAADSAIHVQLVERKILKREKWASGIIKTNLYEALQAQGISPLLAIKLSEIFAWQIDFYRLQKGDSFKAIYDELILDGEPIGISKIRAAIFKHGKEKYYAFLFNSNGKESYFDEDGKGLQKTFLKAPVKFSRITSRYSLRRYHPILHRIRAHLGTDYAAPYGTPIMSTGDGVVIEARYSRYNGNYVKIRHNSIYTTQYLHMSRFARGIHRGVKVKQGQVIGYVGATGLATGPHVCYRFWKNGKQVNHLKLKLPSITSVSKSLLKKFSRQRNKYLKILNSILLSEELEYALD